MAAFSRLCDNIGVKTLTKFNALPGDKILDWSKLKQIADNILKCIKMKN